MAKATGIGGFFFVAADPPALAAWYREHFGILGAPRSYEDTPWVSSEGVTIFEPFPAMEGGPIPAGKGWMLNLRVDDLDEMVASLRAAGVEVEVDPTDYPNGRFASLTDPEGHPLQLWQPA